VNLLLLSIIICYLQYIIVIGCNFKIDSKRQIPFLIGGTITGIIMKYYYGFLFTIIVNSTIWYVISYLVSKYYYKSKGINDQKYLIQYGLSKIKSRNKQ
jgi:5-bromo-4-chloroindolyl phosphate hydrolysis protein